MKVDHIETCVCADHEPTEADSVYYGMPRLKVSRGQEWSVFCPNCGRGGCLDFKSQYLALAHWNKMQLRLKNLDDILNYNIKDLKKTAAPHFPGNRICTHRQKYNTAKKGTPCDHYRIK